MDIKELISYYIDKDTNILEVSFRLHSDTDDYVRNDSIDFDIAKKYGYSIVTENYAFLDTESIEDGFDRKEKDAALDENELMNFLNEYYTINSELMPDTQLY